MHYKRFLFLLLFFIASNVQAEPSTLQKVVIEPLQGGISFNTISFAEGGITGWVTCPTVEMRGRKDLIITNKSVLNNVYLTDISGSTVTGTLYPRDSARFSLSSDVHVYASGSTVDIEVWEVR